MYTHVHTHAHAHTVYTHTCTPVWYAEPTYHIAQNGGGGKLWRIWRNECNSQIFYPAKLQIQ